MGFLNGSSHGADQECLAAKAHGIVPQGLLRRSPEKS